MDKLKHIAAGMGIALLIALPCWLSSNDLFAGLWACLAGVIAGGVKEYTDNKHDGCEWDWFDFAFTCLGAAIGAVIVIVSHFAKG